MPARRVVIADNDPEILALLLTDLPLEGHDVVGSAVDGQGALDLCRRLKPDVLVVDFRMPPGPNGAEVARKVRREMPAVAVVVFTNYATAEVVQAVRKAGGRLVRKGELGELRRAVAGEAS